MSIEVTIVGAGPTGLLAAWEAARRGVSVSVYEEHPVIGQPCHCAGLVSIEGLRRLGIDPEGFILNEVRGCRLYSPSGIALEAYGREAKAYVIDRASFDRVLAERAEAEGAYVETSKRVERWLYDENRIAGVSGSGLRAEAQVSIDAEGASALLSTLAGLERPGGLLGGVNVEVEGVELEPDLVELWFSSQLAPGLFAWVIPLDERRARCGLATASGEPYRRLKAFLSRRFDGEPRHSGPRRGILVTGGPISKTYLNGLMVVGDAAGQTKPTTGGGVILGGLCAIEAGRVAAETVSLGDPSARYLKRYELAWKSMLGGEFSSMTLARRLMNRLRDGDVDDLFKAFKEAELEGLLTALVEEGDMDMQRGVIKMALRDRRLLGIALRILGRVALSELRALLNL
jgi:geranylgeranyl reductase family protein